MKKFFHTFVIKENGAVSLYAIIITLLLFIFNAVLIDYIRIMSAQRDTEQAAMAAARSTMAHFNQDLKSYGLFGLEGGEDKANDIFKQVFEQHLDLSTDGDYFRFTDTTPVDGEISVELHPHRMLGNTATIRYQILEDMKYIAPMEIGASVIESLLKVSEEMEAASTYAKASSKINKDLDNREDKLDKVLKLLEEAERLLDDLDDKIKGAGSSKFPHVGHISHFVQHLEEYQRIVKDKDADTEEMDDDEKEKWEKEQEDAEKFVENVEALFTSIDNSIDSANGKLEEALRLLEEAEELNATIKKKIDDVRSETADNYSDATNARKQLSLEDSGGTGDGSTINDANEALDELVIDQQFFDDLKGKIALASNKVDNGSRQGDDTMKVYMIAFGKMLDDIKTQPVPFARNNVTKMQSAHRDAKDYVKDAIDYFEKNRPEMKTDEVEEKEKEADEKAEETSKELDEILDELEDAGESAEEYKELLGILNDYLAYIGEEPVDLAELDTEDKEAMTDSAMGIVDRIFAKIGAVLLSARDEAYINEYILTRFKSHDFSKSGAEAYAIENNEVEFIMYGLPNSSLNFAAAMAEFTALRFAINFVEAFTVDWVRSMGKFMWIGAILYALDKTIENVGDIKKGERVQFFKDLILDHSYKDYLRFFLFVHPEGNKLARVMARIHQNTDTNLMEQATYVEGTVTTSVQLWFLPGITNMLGQAGIINGRVENNRFYIDKEIIYSY
ncbi:hypothetical protein SAMN05421736_10798 [Evansella caseinilytica]|uniref:Flp pilus-assembly TadE/G-like protein n=1 Tax=Evansella caseinilytica TaxID=1503961 RepID=A0A1H3QXS9_9BACI|nr:Tad domain-containing protein [Evansella caseinilytica]SDZ18156.1 hypothetical protein SAMN05421736_10798 [Evansella caseinilytica]